MNSFSVSRSRATSIRAMHSLHDKPSRKASGSLRSSTFPLRIRTESEPRLMQQSLRAIIPQAGWSGDVWTAFGYWWTRLTTALQRPSMR